MGSEQDQNTLYTCMKLSESSLKVFSFFVLFRRVSLRPQRAGTPRAAQVGLGLRRPSECWN